MTPEELEAEKRKAATLAASGQAAIQPPTAPPAQEPAKADMLNASAGTPPVVDINSTESMTPGTSIKPAESSFALTPDQSDAFRNATNAETDAHASYMDARAGRSVPGTGPDLDAAKRAPYVALADAQSQNAGVQRVDQQGVAAGIGGFFGGKQAQSNFTAGPVSTSNLDTTRGSINDRIAAVDGRQVQTAQGVTLDRSVANQSRAQSQGARGQQQDLAAMLQASAAGNGPSAAQGQLQQATDRNLAQALALGASGHGNPALAMRQAANARASASQDAAMQSSLLKASEQQAARAQLGGVLSGVRGQDLQTQQQDLGAATTQAGFDQQTNIANLTSSVDQQKQNDAMVAQLMASGLSADQAKIQAQTAQAQFNADLLARQEAARNGQSIASGNQQMQAIGTGIAAAGSIAAAAVSDKRAKKNISDGEEETRVFLAALKPHGFEYKDEAHGKGHHLGVMAQDVEIGAPDIVIDDETDGLKKLDVRKALSASLASLGSLNKRLSKVEGKRGR